MRKNLLVVAGLSVMAFGAARAQGLGAPRCPGGAAFSQQQVAQDACQQTYDIFQFLAPQLGAVVAGGNATLGTGSTLGGLGHFSIGVRVNAVQGAYPKLNQYSQSTTGAQRQTLTTKDQLLPFPTADAALGIFGGIPLGVTNMFAIDALASATYIPTINDTDNGFSVTPSQNLQLGYGARIGILQESIVVPGVSVTYLKRDLPTTTFAGKAGNNSLTMNNLKVGTTSIRLVASKSLAILGFAVGVGQDKYETSADITASVNSTLGNGTSSIPGTAQNLTRTNYFGDVSLNLPFFKIVGEAGQVSGGDAVSTYNSFSGGASDRSLTYFSAGIRLAW